VPDVMLVSAHADSNCKSARARNITNIVSIRALRMRIQ
jgi:hypothetical protein